MDYFVKNLKYIRDKLNLKNKDLAEMVCLGDSNFHLILNGAKHLTREHKLDFCNVFGISLDIFENKDFAEYYKNIPVIEMLGMTGVEFYNGFFSKLKNWLVLMDDKNIKDEKYLKYINAIRNPDEAINITQEEWTARNVIDTCLDCYVKTKSPKVCINILILTLFFWVDLHNPISNFNDTLLNNNKNNLFKDEKTQQVEDEFTSYFYFMAMDLLKELHGNKTYQDFVPYYLALKTMFNFTHRPLKSFSDEEARSFGFELMAELEETGNKYAKKLNL